MSAALYCDNLIKCCFGKDFFIYFLILWQWPLILCPLEVYFRRHLHWTTTLNCQIHVQSRCLTAVSVPVVEVGVGPAAVAAVWGGANRALEVISPSAALVHHSVAAAAPSTPYFSFFIMRYNKAPQSLHEALKQAKIVVISDISQLLWPMSK